METIFRARKSLLFDNNNTCIKKEGGLSYVTMGAYGGAEVCELVGTYLLRLIAEKYNKNDIGLYRDDGLATLLALITPTLIFRWPQIRRP